MSGRRIALFAGTYEGHELAEFLEGAICRAGRESTACPMEDTGEKERSGEKGTTEGKEAEIPQAWVFVATDYGRQVLGRPSGVQVVCGRKNREQIRAFLQENGIGLVIDATHPFAREVSQNIRLACEEAGVRLERLVRDSALTEAEIGEKEKAGKVILADSIPEAVRYLARMEGNIFVTTGSKEAACYTRIPGFDKRVFLRVLPGTEVRESLIAMGFAKENIIQAEGPFDQAQNEAVLRQNGIAILVTKDSGAHSGSREKLLAAEAAGVTAVLIRRQKEAGRTSQEIQRLLTDYLEGREKKQI